MDRRYEHSAFLQFSCTMAWIGVLCLHCRSRPGPLESTLAGDSGAVIGMHPAAAPLSSVDNPQAAGDPRSTEPPKFPVDHTPIEGEINSYLPPLPNQLIQLATDGKEIFGSEFWSLVSSDGKLFLARVKTAEDRVFPGLSVRIYDVERDRVLREMTISYPDECAKLQAPTCSRILDTRLRTINDYLAQYRWTPLTFFTPAPWEVVRLHRCHDKDTTQRLVLPKLTITYSEPRLRMLRADGKVILDRTYPEWVVRTTKHCNASHRSYIYDIGLDIDRGVVLVWISYCGTDTCEAPPGHDHLYRLPPF